MARCIRRPRLLQLPTMLLWRLPDRCFSLSRRVDRLALLAEFLKPFGVCQAARPPRRQLLAPSNPAIQSTRRYVNGSAVLETAFETEGGTARIFDCLPVVDGIRQIRPLREVLRIVEGVRGTISFRASIDPRPDYAKFSPSPKFRSRLGWSYAWRNEIMNVQTDIELAQEHSTLCGTFSVAPGQRRYFSLSYCQSEPAVIPPLGGIADNVSKVPSRGGKAGVSNKI